MENNIIIDESKIPEPKRNSYKRFLPFFILLIIAVGLYFYIHYKNTVNYNNYITQVVTEKDAERFIVGTENISIWKIGDDTDSGIYSPVLAYDNNYYPYVAWIRNYSSECWGTMPTLRPCRREVRFRYFNGSRWLGLGGGFYDVIPEFQTIDEKINLEVKVFGERQVLLSFDSYNANTSSYPPAKSDLTHHTFWWDESKNKWEIITSIDFLKNKTSLSETIFQNFDINYSSHGIYVPDETTPPEPVPWKFRNDYVGVGASAPWPIYDGAYSTTGVDVEQETVAASSNKQKEGAVFRGTVCKSGTTGMDCIMGRNSSKGLFYYEVDKTKNTYKNITPVTTEEVSKCPNILSKANNLSEYKTYSNKYYSIKYPAFLDLNEDGGITYSSFKDTSCSTLYSFIIQHELNVFNCKSKNSACYISLDNFQKARYQVENTSHILIDNKETIIGHSSEVDVMGFTMYQYFIRVGDNAFSIVTSSKAGLSEKILNNMISTLKFN